MAVPNETLERTGRRARTSRRIFRCSRSVGLDRYCIASRQGASINAFSYPAMLRNVSSRNNDKRLFVRYMPSPNSKPNGSTARWTRSSSSMSIPPRPSHFTRRILLGDSPFPRTSGFRSSVVLRPPSQTARPRPPRLTRSQGKRSRTSRGRHRRRGLFVRPFLD